MIDLPEHGLKCGEYGDLPKAVAAAYAKSGHFDPNAAQEAVADASGNGVDGGAAAGGGSVQSGPEA